jgi:hypothetical protein
MPEGLVGSEMCIRDSYYDYDGQKDIEYNGVRYSVLRHYRRPGSIELELVVVADAST